MPWLPVNVSSYGSEVDAIFYVILWVTGIIFVLVEATLLWFAFRYRHRAGREADHIHGNWKIEVVWTAIPFLIVIILGAMSWGPWSAIKSEARFPDAGLELGVHAAQFEWTVTYPGPDGRLGTGDDFDKRNQLHVPAGRPVRVHLSSEDVIHSFFLPHFRVKQDVVPGMELSTWFEASEPGEYELACAELCGTGHTRMKASVTVHTPEEFQAWHRAEAETAAN
ncbi:MAG: cytochrome c oxidase subunit II [Gemmatimonadetes bacterium]|nr:cytochrome c oxidase subunit II [Gemmatimonadota bacterium]NIU80243.1 cytochrome c oxidase subunit II [Gammaproteobacteria bacterium]NIP83717.1 cytochrome c oxidase subunit II [Gemmatimonadota bacterium]NIW38262.1 cytochrome c oxidase subunit II [Gemmatimonadota bacterium]NIX48628.1 cytochrome c oxidase subunit II [Gemmatimonadota bacterium]